MPEIGLTGGIGSGKSTVAAGLVARGALLIDADVIVHDLQAPGKPVFEAMVQRWGPVVVADDGTLNRGAVAEIVFADAEELAALNSIVHPAVATEMKARRQAASETLGDSGVVVLDIPLLVPADGEPIAKRYRDLSGIVVVDAHPEVAVERLVANRGFSEEDARARVARQASRESRLAVADFVIDNNGPVESLEPQLNACWHWALSLN